MKKLILTFFILVFFSAHAFADAIYDSKGSVITGNIEGIADGLIHIKNNGNIITIVRPELSPVYKDSVTARKRLISKLKIKYSGRVVFVDNGFVKILCEDALVVIPRYKVTNIELYVP